MVHENWSIIVTQSAFIFTSKGNHYLPQLVWHFVKIFYWNVTIVSVKYKALFYFTHDFFFVSCRVDEERVRLAGPDRAAAEWVLRNGGAIKWTTSSNHLNDYNMLPTTQFENYKLEEIDLTGTDVIGIGFEHLSTFLFIPFLSVEIDFILKRQLDIFVLS